MLEIHHSGREPSICTLQDIGDVCLIPRGFTLPLLTSSQFGETAAQQHQSTNIYKEFTDEQSLATLFAIY